jgi:hypothetical protein
VRAHDDLGVPRDQFPVDVYTALSQAQVRIMWRPAARLLGAYLCDPGAERGVLLNCELSASARRHTAAHELGHDRFGHGSQIDREGGEHGEYLDAAPAAGWPTAEKEAESFAAWFLMPLPAVHAAMARLGLTGVVTADELYQLSLRLGTHFRTTARHLRNAHLVGPAQSTQWMRARPERLKAALDRGATPPASRARDVWRIDHHSAGEHIVLSPGDRLVIDHGCAPAPTVPAWMTVLAEVTIDDPLRRRLILQATERDQLEVGRVEIDGPVPWDSTLKLVPKPGPGLDPRTCAQLEHDEPLRT